MTTCLRPHATQAKLQPRASRLRPYAASLQRYDSSLQPYAARLQDYAARLQRYAASLRPHGLCGRILGAPEPEGPHMAQELPAGMTRLYPRQMSTWAAEG